MSNRDKMFTWKEAIDILGTDDDTTMVINNNTKFGSYTNYTYQGMVKLEIYLTLLSLGYDEKKLDEFCQPGASGLCSDLFICKHADDKETGYIRIDLVSIRQNLGKKIAAWEQSKKPAEKEMNPYEKACKEWLKGCSNTTEANPAYCYSCTQAFLGHVQSIGKGSK